MTVRTRRVVRTYLKRRKRRARLSAIERFSKTLSIAAIPVVLAVGGWVIQKQLQNQAVSRDYVQLAVSILREPATSVKPEIRSWAVDLLRANSPTPFSDELSQRLKSGESTLAFEKLTSVSSSCLTPALDNELHSALVSFQQFLKICGFDVVSGEIRYEAVPGNLITVDGVQYLAYYDNDNGIMRVACAYARDTDLIKHEYMRHVLVPNDSGAPHVGTNSSWFAYYSVDSGLALYFPCSQRGRPLFGTPGAETAVSLSNDLPIASEIRDAAAAENAGAAWAGAFWEIRQALPHAQADKLLASSWRSWHPTQPAGLSASFVAKILETERASGGGHADQIRQIFKRRGISL
jgi:hypothetical protein